MDRDMNDSVIPKAMWYPQQLPVIRVHMLEAAVVCSPVVPTLPVPLLKCLTFHPPSPPSHDRACVWEGRVDIECVCVCACAHAVYQGMNKSQRA